MIKRYVVPLLAVGAIAWTLIYVFFLGNKPLPSAQPVLDPPSPVYQNYISAAGIVESASENIAIGTPLAGIVKEIFVQEGSDVQAGDPLFMLDDREAEAQLAIAESRVATSRAQEKEARTNFENATAQFEKMKNLRDSLAVSRDEFDKIFFALRAAEAALESAKAQTASAAADVNAARTTLDRLIVKAPINGQVLKLNLRLGEFAPAGAVGTPLLMLGDTENLHIRADIDEGDAWRFQPGGKAHANLRGNPEQKVDLTFVRVQPYVTPKRSLTGDSQERVDTRVLQVIYSFPHSALNAYVGQLMDVFIDVVPQPSTPEVVQNPAEQ